MRIVWRDEAKAAARRFMADQAGMRILNEAVLALADNPAPPGAFVRGSYRRLRAGDYRVVYEAEDDAIVIVRVDRVI